MTHPAADVPHQPLSGCMLCGTSTPLNPTVAQARRRTRCWILGGAERDNVLDWKTNMKIKNDLQVAPSLALAAFVGTQVTATDSVTDSR